VVDFVGDTPAEWFPYYGPLPAPGRPYRDTCYTLPGRDPIENYMDYSDDSAYSRFTEGQRIRMDSINRRYRGF
jgi:hypothetical protein